MFRSNEHGWSYQLLHAQSTTYHRVPTSPGLFSKVSRTFKVLENEFEPVKYWKLRSWNLLAVEINQHAFIHIQQGVTIQNIPAMC